MTCPHCGHALEPQLRCSGCGHEMNLAHATPLELKAGDLTPEVGGWTDVAPLGVEAAHERTAAEEAGLADWDRIASMPEFRQMIASKVKFVTAATVFFVLYYFALPVLVGYWPRLMDRRVIGPVNLAYLFALSQFFMAWFLAWLYMRVASRFDQMSKNVLQNLESERARR